MVDHAVAVARAARSSSPTRGSALGKLAHAHRSLASAPSTARTSDRRDHRLGRQDHDEGADARRARRSPAPTHAAEGSLNNETGVPLTLLGLRAFHAFGVIEMGMRGAGQIEYLTKIAEPDVAVVVNAGTAHIELLGSTDAIAQAKAEIWLGLRDGGTIVRPADDERLARWAREHQPRARHVTFGDERRRRRPARRVHADRRRRRRSTLDAFGERQRARAPASSAATPRSTRAPRSPPRTPPALRSIRRSPASRARARRRCAARSSRSPAAR